MCIIHNSVGALSHVESHLLQHRVYGVKSLSELQQCEKDYEATRQQIEAKHTLAIRNEYAALKAELERSGYEYAQHIQDQNERLDQLITDLKQKSASLFLSEMPLRTTLINMCWNAAYWLTIWIAPLILKFEQAQYTRKYNKLLAQQRVRYQYLDDDLDAAIRQSSWSELRAHAEKKDIIEAIKPSIYGAIGEKKVEDELRKLPDDYILINDFRCTFRPALYNKREKDAIQSVQIDHVLIAPSGVFLIETKNWSQRSLENAEFRSPVRQVKRTNFALFILLENTRIRKHHLGERKLPIRNVIVFTGKKPIGQFEYVEILALPELLGYVSRFPPCLTRDEVGYLAHYLLDRIDGRSNCKLMV